MHFKGQNMKIAIAKELFRSGVFNNVHLVRNPMGAGWNLILKGYTRGEEVLSTDRGETRVFKGVEAAIRAAEEIGFKQLIIDIDTTKPQPLKAV